MNQSIYYIIYIYSSIYILFINISIIHQYIYIIYYTYIYVYLLYYIYHISIDIFNVLGGNWDPTDKKLSSVNSYRQDLSFLHAKHSLRKPPHVQTCQHQSRVMTDATEM